MARLPRFDMPSVAQHIVQRGNDRLPCFAAELDYIRYLQDLRDVAQHRGCVIHAYVLMTNHVHLLIASSKIGAISSMMQALGHVMWATSIDTIIEREPCGRCVINPVWLIRKIMCCAVIVILSSIHCVPAWWIRHRLIVGLVIDIMRKV
jgi:REP element-mobilizing transposase RayT